MGKLRAPEPLDPEHDVQTFDCGIDSLNQWIRRQAFKNQGSGASRTFVVCEDGKVIGYYALATGSVARQSTPGKIRRAMPDPIPVIVLGRLAIDRRKQRRGIGSALLRDALLRTYNVSTEIGVRALLVHALSEEAKGFYLRHGFQESPIEPLTLMLNIESVRASLEKGSPSQG